MMKKIISFSIIGALLIFVGAHAFADAIGNAYPIPAFKKSSASLNSDFFVKHLWQQAEKPLYLDRWLRRLFFIKNSARNINADGSVPDSHFFEGRIAKGTLSPEEVKKGNVTSGVNTNGKLTVIKAKNDGLSIGFIISDASGERFLLKVDSQANPELPSSSEVISSRLFHAIGYHVPEYTITYFTLDQLEIKEGIEFYDETGFKKLLDQEGLRWLLRNAYLNSDRKYRASASKFLKGKILGPMDFHGRRRKDPLDTIPHQHRRELRGLRVFCSWLNHFDLRRGNSLDVVIEEEDRWYVKHYLLDFAGTLGAYIDGPKLPQVGHERVIDITEIFSSILTLGFYERPWEEQERPQIQTGYFTNIGFSPGKWKTHIPNYAFQNMKKEDAIWAAKILQYFSDEHIRAAVAAGMISNKEAREDLAEKLIARRDIIIDYWLSREG